MHKIILIIIHNFYFRYSLLYVILIKFKYLQTGFCLDSRNFFLLKIMYFNVIKVDDIESNIGLLGRSFFRVIVICLNISSKF